ncbi:efflux RND transporter periplasmic adaptor subunit [Chitinophaga agrisoli]|uniref:Efflux RND transporter periplasmic adaptor subunit n=1 Tax=Chitinophaga agrisoli TaxID=2607653 RepID=A0A5B2VJ73_9BACT|nr:efflux RND transporter periplasmic adaptor subunit [Chitinophaga agrisoli]KAA2238718.1 efflux RND transporter periplasmic adaptor subunit [Chitinophaga agrisoli]
MKRYKWLIISIAIILIVAIWFWKFRSKAAPVLVETEKPTYGFIANAITATGTIQPVDTVSVGTQVSGTIKYIYADFNTTVKKDQLVAELDKSLLQAQVDQYKANLSAARDQLAYQQSNFARQTQLFQVGAISKADFETAQFQFNSAKANVAAIQAQLASATQNLAYTNIYSPIDGVVLSRNVNIGQTVAASFNTPTLFIIAKDLTKMQVQASVDEADIGNVEKGQRVTFTVDAFPDDVFNGTVQEVRLQPSTSANVVTYVTIIDAPNNDLRLKPGMTANITIYTKEVKNAMLVSAKALKFKPDSALLKDYIIVGRGDTSHARKEPGFYRSKRPDTLKTATDTSKRLTSPDEAAHPASVWLKHGDTIIRRRILTGMNDETNVQVVHGLDTSDIIVNDARQVTKKEKAAAAKSPFMPSRPRRGGR